MSFPITDADLTTDRLVLRPWTAAEVAAVLEGARRPYWAEDFPTEGDRVIAGLYSANPAWFGAHGHRLVIERASGLVVGSIGLFWPPSEGAVELGYGITPSRQRRGYASEAARALTAFALAAPDVHTVYADVELSNPPSIRVLEKAGFERWSTDPDRNRARYGTTRGDQPTSVPVTDRFGRSR